VPAVAKASYHHGNLRRALLDAALAVIAERGPHALSLRDLASRTGVSHAAPAHHFGDKAGLLTAVAIEGYERLGDELEQAGSDGDFLDAGLAYVRFATRNPAHFQVMFQPALYRADDPAVEAARARTSAVLYGTAATMPAASGASATEVGVGGWCLVHGLATLWLSGNLGALADDPVDLARSIASTAFGGPDAGGPPRSS
jgi:AcrR family transcriptional regulator